MQVLDLETLTPERANEIWEHVRNGVIDDFSVDNPSLFASILTAPNTVVFEHANGIAILSHIYPRLGAELHFWSWGDVDEVEIVSFGRKVIAYAFETYQLERLTATPPGFNRMASRIATALRFQYEGCVRHAFLYHGKYHDVFIYGLLRRDVA